MLPQDEAKYLEILRKIPPEKKLKTAFDLYDFARARFASEILRQNPGIDTSHLNRLVKEKFAGK